MNEPRERQSDRQAEFLREVMQENASIDADIVAFGNGSWAIHGMFPYDGEVPLAVFETYDEARQVLDEVCGTTRRTHES
jgi:hypothetical protein